MKISQTRLVEIISVVAVVLSLLFVGMQLILDRRVAIAGQYSDRAESSKSDIRAKLESDAYMLRQSNLWLSGERPSWWTEDMEANHKQTGLTGADVMVRVYELQLNYISYDNLYFQYQQGLLPEIFWSGARLALKRDLRQPIPRAVYTNMSRPIQLVTQELIAEIENE